jgi:hypothetical protein
MNFVVGLSANANKQVANPIGIRGCRASDGYGFPNKPGTMEFTANGGKAADLTLAFNTE